MDNNTYKQLLNELKHLHDVNDLVLKENQKFADQNDMLREANKNFTTENRKQQQLIEDMIVLIDNLLVEHPRREDFAHNWGPHKHKKPSASFKIEEKFIDIDKLDKGKK